MVTVMPLEDLKECFDKLLITNAAVSYLGEEWVPFFRNWILELETKDSAFWMRKGVSRFQFIAHLCKCVLILAPFQPQDDVYFAIERLLPLGTVAWQDKEIHLSLPDNMINRLPDKYAESFTGKFRVLHPISCGIKRFYEWDQNFLLALFKKYAELFSPSSSLDLDILREALINNASVDLVINLVAFFYGKKSTVRRKRFLRGRMRLWALYIGGVIKDIGTNLTEDDIKIQQSLDQLNMLIE